MKDKNVEKSPIKESTRYTLKEYKLIIPVNDNVKDIYIVMNL